MKDTDFINISALTVAQPSPWLTWHRELAGRQMRRRGGSVSAALALEAQGDAEFRVREGRVNGVSVTRGYWPAGQ